MAKHGLNSGSYWSNFGGKSGVDDAGSLLGSFPNIKKFEKIHFFDPHTHTDLPLGVGNWAVSRAGRHLRLGLLPKTLFI